MDNLRAMGDKVNDDGNGATGYNDNDNDDDNNTSLMTSNEGDNCRGQQLLSR
jgi:hypothetical protein